MSTKNQNACPPYHDADFPANDDKASEKPAMFGDKGLAENMSKPPEHNQDLRRESTIAEEHAKDVESKFWATYKEVSNEYDDDFLERANDDMAIILTFAGLFSAVNSTFIVGMQPNPGDTTNMLMLELIKIVADPNAVYDISGLSSSTGYSSSSVWTQTLAYTSLSFSLLAAFGAVMGKQWLNSYKAARSRGSLEERCLQRQRKLDGLEDWRLQMVLGVFLVLLQISLLLFGLSLSANMFTQQRTISSVVICTTAVGILFYVATVLISALHPDSPFQTAGSVSIGTICSKFSKFIDYLYLNYEFLRRFLQPSLRVTSRFTSSKSDKLSAVRWILETSTDPEVVGAAAAMVPIEQWRSEFEALAIYTRLRSTFRAYRGRQELCVKYVKAMTHLCSQSVINDSLWIDEDMWECGGGKGRFVRDAFVAGRLAWDQSKGKDHNEQKKHKADARTALRTIIVHGMRTRLSHPDDEEVIWNGDLRWCHSNGTTPSCEEFDWLIDYLAGSETNYQTEGDALLALSAMCGLGSSSKRHSYVNVLIRCMDPTRPSRVRNAALRAVSDASEELASITCGSMPQGVDATLLDKLSRALSTVICPSHNQTMRDSSADTKLVDQRDCCYLRLIFILVQNEEWYNRLTRDDHIERCISLYDKVLTSPLALDKVYLSGILLRINPASKDAPNLAQEKWWTLIRRAWDMSCYNIEPLLTLVAVTRQHLPDPHNDVARAELAALATDVQGALGHLKFTEDFRDWHPGGIMTLVDAALPPVQGLYDHLSLYAEHRDISQVDNELVGS